MGMYDNIKCSAPLPGNPPEFVKAKMLFQTKNLDNSLSVYEITENGELLLTSCMFGNIEKPIKQTFHGDIYFYDSNWVSIDQDGMHTKDGEDYESVKYKARFNNGKLESIIEVERTKEKATKEKPLKKPTPKEIEEYNIRKNESLLNKKGFLAWGGEPVEVGKYLEIIAEGPKEWVGKYEDGTFEIINRWQRDLTFFKSLEEAVEFRKKGK